MSHSPKKIDLTGQRYGRLTVVAPAENVGGRTAWLCRCDCGKETIVKSHHLRSGHTRSCGCKKGNRGSGSSLAYIDETYVEMLRERAVRSNNTSGVPGVEWLEKQQR